MNRQQKVIEVAKVLFVGANLVSNDGKEISIEETCEKFKSVKLPITIIKEKKNDNY